jgi:hypothetical protein
MMMIWVEHVACMGMMRNAYKMLVGKLDGKGPLRGPRRHRWDDNVELNLKEIGMEVVLDSSVSGLGLVAGLCEHGNETLGSITGREFLDYLSILLAPQKGLCSMELVMLLIYIDRFCAN